MSASIKIGLALFNTIDETGEINVKVGTITSSPFLIPNIFKETCNALVPFIHAIAYLTLVNFAILFSNLIISLPAEEIQLLFIQLVRFFISSFPTNGSFNPIIFFI